MSDDTPDPQFESLLEFLKQNRGFDFTGYKRASLIRRVRRRMSLVKVDGFDEYVDYLEVHPGEFQALFDTILINVTSFFRDQPAWDCLAAEVLPRIVQSRSPGEPIRIWSAGCASGEEAYSLVMLLAEQMGAEQARRWVKLYGTDVDENALLQARQGRYSAESLKSVPAGLREKYFERNGSGFSFASDLRRVLVFGRHDLMYDAPISHLDLLCCRNTLIYFNREAQERIVAHLHFALKEMGCLFLGRSEMLLSFDDLFVETYPRHRIFTKVLPIQTQERFVALGRLGEFPMEPSLAQALSLREAAFQANRDAVIVVDANNHVATANNAAMTLFRLENRDLGRPFRDLEVSYRPVELRSLAEQVQREKRSVRVQDVPFRGPSQEPIYLDVLVAPLTDDGGKWLGIAFSFRDMSEQTLLRAEVDRCRHEVETAYEELQSTNEELETSNEELQSTVEELQTTNEELQSTSEEMETMNEELQAGNEELQAVNDELRDRTDALDRSNVFLESILGGVDLGIVVIDREFQVLLWNSRAADMWGLRPEEVMGHSLFSLDIGLPVEELRKPIQETWLMGGPPGGEVTLDAVNRRGRAIRIRVTGALSQGARRGPQCLVLLMQQLGAS